MMRALWWKLRTWFSRSRLESELRDELAFHREMLERDATEQTAIGADRARYARHRLGNVTAVAEATRLQWGFPRFEALLSDARYALRSLAQSPSFSLAAVFTLALGVAAVVAIFTLVDTVLLRPLPYRDGTSLVSVYSTPRGVEARTPFSYPDFRDVRSFAESRGIFSHAVFARGDQVRVRGEMGAEGVPVAFVTEGLFPMMGVAPLIGRTLAAEDERAGAERTIVLGHRLWMQRFGGDPHIVGRTLDAIEGAFTVVGVMPASFAWPEWADAWTSLSNARLEDASLLRREYRVDARTIARLAPGVSSAQADAAIRAYGDRLAEQYPAENGELTMRLTALRREIMGPVQRPLFVLFASVAGLLLIACANVGNLSLARAGTRAREIGVRLAIGASRARIVRQLLVESSILALAGGVLGTAAAYGAVRVLVRFAPADIPRLPEVAVDARVLGFALAVCGLCVLLFGLAPALTASSSNLASSIREAGRSSSTTRRTLRLQSALIVSEIAIAVALVVGAGLLMKSLARLNDADPGFDPQQLLTLRIEPLPDKYPSPERRLLLYDSIRDAVALIPGVARVSYINHIPATRAGVVTPLESDGDPRPGGLQPSAVYRLVDAGYFETMQQRMVRGRPFTRAEISDKASVAIVNEALARRLWGASNPVGRRIVAFKQATGTDAGARLEAQVIGVAADVKDFDQSSDSWAEVYYPFPVNPWRSMYLAVRTHGDPRPIIPIVQRTVATIDPDLPVRGTHAVDQMLRNRLARRSFSTTIVAAFGSVALILASLGVYGIVAYGVTQRTREIGVRAALGASAGQLVRALVGRATRTAALGVALGLAVTVSMGGTVRSMLFGLAPTDPATLIQVAAVVIAVAALAAYVPARRALRVDPVIAIRAD